MTPVQEMEMVRYILIVSYDNDDFFCSIILKHCLSYINNLFVVQVFMFIKLLNCLGYYWCSTETDYYGNHKQGNWGYCGTGNGCYSYNNRQPSG